MKKRQWIIVSVIVFLIVALFVLMDLFFGKDKGFAKRAKPSTTKYVNVATFNPDTIRVKVHAMGRITSSRNVNLTAEVQGKLEEGSVPLKTGQDFRRGDLLFRINDEEVKLALQSRKSNFLNAVASVLPDLKIDYNNNFKTWEQFFNKINVTKPIPNLPETKSASEKTFLASRNILGEYYGIKADEERLQKYRIYAPFDGSYTSTITEVGTVVNPGNQIARIIEVGDLELRLPIPTEEIVWIKKGLEVEIFIEEGGETYNGKIARVSNNVNENSQSVDVFVDIDNKVENLLFEGMYVEAHINAGEVDSAMVLPRKAIFSGNQIYTVEDSILRIRDVVIHKVNRETYVVGGLETGVLYVPEPLIGVQEGQSVIPIKK